MMISGQAQEFDHILCNLFNIMKELICEFLIISSYSSILCSGLTFCLSHLQEAMWGAGRRRGDQP